MNTKVLGSILLIVAMSIGAGLLSLPVATAGLGFYRGAVLLTVIWLAMMGGALCILEVSLWLPEDTNLVSMARHTLGRGGETVTWACYLLMLYCILCIYISGGTDLFNSVWQALHLAVPAWISSVLFVLLLGAIIWHGIKLIDHSNRLLMACKMIAYALLVVFLLPVAQHGTLPSGAWRHLSGAVMPAVFSFGYAIIIPSLRSYLKSDIKHLRWVVIIGSTVPLLCYLLWNYVVQGTMDQARLLAIEQSGKVVSQLNVGLSAAGNPWATTLVHIFTAICVLTAFLAVSLSLSDFIADGIKRKKTGKNKWLIYALTFLPALAIVLFRPYLYMAALHYAGILVVLVLMLLPVCMVWRGRRIGLAATSGARYRLPGGIPVLALLAAISVILLIFAATHL